MEGKAIAIAIIAILCVGFAYNSAIEYGNNRFLDGLDIGAMGIIKQLVAGKNVDYTDSSGQNYFIEVGAENPVWIDREAKGTICVSCHKYSTKYFEKGGEG